MMGRSHVMIGLAATAAVIAGGLLPLTPAVLGVAVLASLLPDIDTPYSTLGCRLPFLAAPLHALVGHRTATHSLLALAIAAAAVPLVSDTGYPAIALAAFIGLASHIFADLVTAEGCALLYPMSRTRFSYWPGIVTGGFAEPFVAVVISGALLAFAYRLDPAIIGRTTLWPLLYSL